MESVAEGIATCVGFASAVGALTGVSLGVDTGGIFFFSANNTRPAIVAGGGTSISEQLDRCCARAVTQL